MIWFGTKDTENTKICDTVEFLEVLCVLCVLVVRGFFSTLQGRAKLLTRYFHAWQCAIFAHENQEREMRGCHARRQSPH